jgi:hypothetical protein
MQMEGGKTPHGWIAARNALEKINPGDLIVVALPGRRIGRIGKILNKFDGLWDPLVTGDPRYKKGEEQGRRIFVRWELDRGAPDDPDLVAQLPEGEDLGRGALSHLNLRPIEWYRQIIANPANWVGLVGRFNYEKALSDYIAFYPHRLKPGLVPYPNQKIREKLFKDHKRADVLLRDRELKPVIVECKRESPEVGDVQQLRGYIKRLKRETGEQASGILVHGGARMVDKKVWSEVKKFPPVEVFQYDLKVEFVPSAHG